MPIKRYEIRYLPLFQNDLRQIVQYILNTLKNSDAAEAIVDSIEKAIVTRSYCAESFKPYPSTRNRELPYYAIYVNNYVVYYVVIDHQIMEVRRCLNKGRDRVNLI